MTDRNSASDRIVARLTARGGLDEGVATSGYFTAICRDADGNELWRDGFANLLTTLAKNLLLDTTLAGSAYTTVGPFMGLISSASFTAVSAADTFTSHSGWLEANATNAPAYTATGGTANRATCVWSAASAGAKALSTGLVFTFTQTGTVQGACIVTGTGASATWVTTTGVLYSAGTLTTPQPVISTNTLTLSYTTTLT